MKIKRALSILLSVVMLLTLVPTNVIAAQEHTHSEESASNEKLMTGTVAGTPAATPVQGTPEAGGGGGTDTTVTTAPTAPTTTAPTVPTTTAPTVPATTPTVPTTANDEEISAVQALIDALPTVATVSAQDYDAVQDAYDRYDALSEEQRAKIVGAEVFEALFAWFSAQVAPLGTGDVAKVTTASGETFYTDVDEALDAMNGDDRTFTLLADASSAIFVRPLYGGTYDIGSYTLNLNSNPEWRGSVKFVGNGGRIYEPGRLCSDRPYQGMTLSMTLENVYTAEVQPNSYWNFTATGAEIGNLIVPDSAGQITLSEGTKINLLRSYGRPLVDLLANGCAYYAKDSTGQYTVLVDASKPYMVYETKQLSDVKVAAHTCAYDACGKCACGRNDGTVRYFDGGSYKYCDNYTLVTSSTTTWQSGWYVVKEDTTIADTVTIASGENVYLILCDGTTLTTEKGIKGENASLTTYSQAVDDSANAGTLISNGTPYENNESYGMSIGYFTLQGGNVRLLGRPITDAEDNKCRYSIGLKMSGTVDDPELPLRLNVQRGNASLYAAGGDVTRSAPSSVGTSIGLYLSNHTLVRAVDDTSLTAVGGNINVNSTFAESYGILEKAASTVEIAGGKCIARGGTVSDSMHSGAYGDCRMMSVGVDVARLSVSGTLACFEATAGNVDCTFGSETLFITPSQVESIAAQVREKLKIHDGASATATHGTVTVSSNDPTGDATIVEYDWYVDGEADIFGSAMWLKDARVKGVLSVSEGAKPTLLADGYALYDVDSSLVDLSAKMTPSEVRVLPHTCAFDSNGKCACGRNETAIAYLDANGVQRQCRLYTVLDGTMKDWIGGWYAVKADTTIADTVTIANGEDVHLILCNGATLTTEKGISKATINTEKVLFAIYAQTKDLDKAGTLSLSGDFAFDGDESDRVGMYLTSSVFIVNGGTVNVTPEAPDDASKLAASYGQLNLRAIHASYAKIAVNGGALTARTPDITIKGTSAITSVDSVAVNMHSPGGAEGFWCVVRGGGTFVAIGGDVKLETASTNSYLSVCSEGARYIARALVDNATLKVMGGSVSLKASQKNDFERVSARTCGFDDTPELRIRGAEAKLIATAKDATIALADNATVKTIESVSCGAWVSGICSTIKDGTAEFACGTVTKDIVASEQNFIQEYDVFAAQISRIKFFIVDNAEVKLKKAMINNLYTRNGTKCVELLADGSAFYQQPDGSGTNFSEYQINQDDKYTVTVDASTATALTYVVVKAHNCAFDSNGKCVCGRTQTPVDYLDENGATKQCKVYTVLDGTMKDWNDGWYVVTKDTTIADTVTIAQNADVHLILCNGATLTTEKGIKGENASLTIYAQSADLSKAGKLISKEWYTGSTSQNAIVSIDVEESITVNGGVIQATVAQRNNDEVGKFTFKGINTGTLTVNRGSVTGQVASNSASDCATCTLFTSFGIYATTALTIRNNATVSGIVGDLTLTNGGDEISVAGAGVYADNLHVQDTASLTATAGIVRATASGSEYAYAEAISRGIKTTSLKTVGAPTIRATAGNVQMTMGGKPEMLVYSLAIDAKTADINGGEFILVHGTANGTYGDGSLDKKEGDMYARTSAAVSGGTLKLERARFDGTLTVTNGVKLSDLLKNSTYGYKSGTTWYTGNISETSLSSVSILPIPLTSIDVTSSSTSDSYAYGDNVTLSAHVDINSAVAVSEDDLYYRWYKVDGTSKTAVADGYDKESFAPTMPNVGSHTYECVVTADDYSISDSITFTVRKATLADNDTLATTLKGTLTGYSGAYDATEHDAVTVNTAALPSGWTVLFATERDGSYTTSVPQVKNVSDSKTVYVKFSNANYNDYATETTATVSKAPLTIASVTAANKTYDGNTTATVSSLTFGGLQNSETLTEGTDYTVNATFDDANAGNGKNVTVTVALANTAKTGNYTLSNDTATATANIAKAPLTIASVTAANKTYDGNTTATVSSLTLGGLQNSETLTEGVDYTVNATFDDANAGNGKNVTVTVALANTAKAGNYVLSNDTATATANIAKATLAISSVTAANKTYDGNTTATVSSLTFGGLQNSETLTEGTDYTANAVFDDANAGNGKNVTVTVALANTAKSGNYVLSSDTKPTTANIAKAPLTIASVTAANKTYDGNTTATVSSLTFGGLQNSETLTEGTDYTVNAVFDDANAGDGKNVTVTVALANTAKAGNYMLPNDTATATANIAKAMPTKNSQTETSVIAYFGAALEYAKFQSKDEFFGVDGRTILTGQFEWTDKTKIADQVNMTETLYFKPDDSNYADYPLTLTFLAYNPNAGSSIAFNITVTETKNEDGSTTKTEIDNDTGTKTETTVYPDGRVTTVITEANGKITATETTPDGSKTVTETAVDGTQSVTEIDKDGNKITTTQTPDGGKVTEESRTDGTTIKTITDQNGQTEADIIAPAGKETTVTIPVENAKEVTKLIVTDEQGNTTEIADFEVTEQGIRFTAAGDCKLQLVREERGTKKEFADVHAVFHWAIESIDYVIEKGLMKGISEDKFGPDQPLTRGMLVTVLYRAAGEPEVEGFGSFGDVPQDSYYAKAVAWAQQNGIVSGTSDEAFSPDESITREQIAVILFRYARYMGIAPAGAWAIRLDYADLADIADYAAEGVMYCTMKGIMQGKGDGQFAPKAPATRAEIAAVLQRFLEGIDATK